MTVVLLLTVQRSCVIVKSPWGQYVQVRGRVLASACQLRLVRKHVIYLHRLLLL